jgi:uncharacterized protein
VANDNFFWSRFSHVIEKEEGNLFSAINTLRLRPVYFGSEFFPIIPLIQSGEIKCGDDLKKFNFVGKVFDDFISLLLDASILLREGKSDDAILNHFRDGFVNRNNMSILYLLLTDKCNLGCKYCFIEPKSDLRLFNKGLFMDNDIVTRSIDVFARIKNPDFNSTIILYGGEPLLNLEAIKKAALYCKELKSRGVLSANTNVSVITNGTIMPDEFIELASTGDISVCMSIDGPRDVHDANRKFLNGGGTFDIAYSNFSKLRKRNIPVNISLTITEEVLNNQDEVIKWLCEDVNSSCTVNIIRETEYYKPKEDYFERANDFMINVFERMKEFGLTEDRIMRKVRALRNGYPHIADCAAQGAGQMVVAPDGNIGVCHGYLFSREHFFGDVWDSSEEISKKLRMSDWLRRIALNMDECLDCFALGVCGGGCPHQAELKDGSIWSIDRPFCVHSKKAFKWLIWKVLEVGYPDGEFEK